MQGAESSYVGRIATSPAGAPGLAVFLAVCRMLKACLRSPACGEHGRQLVTRMLEAVVGPDCKVGVHSWCAAGCTNLSLPAAALSSGSEAGDSVPWHRTYRC